jgi:N-acetylneuraminic acid mutarotase
MIVWGGYFFNGIGNWLNTGGRYDPSTDSWTPTSITNVPTGRELHTAVWTGSEMIVWGGYRDDLHTYFNTGGRYNPSTDTWTGTSTSNAPDGRNDHTAVWSGSEMIVWGGLNETGALDTGGRYNPSTDSWTATGTTNVPTGRYSHTAVWTGSEMIVWGGFFYNGNFNNLNTGGTYNPAMDSWTATSTNNAPSGRENHTAVWTGSEMIVWGGAYFTGSNYTDLNTGGRYNPSTDSWTATSTRTGSVPSVRYFHRAVWTGSEMIVWGGWNGSFDLNTGGKYNPGTDNWTAISTTNAPTSRQSHTAVWTGSEMIVWGGSNGAVRLNTGGRYNPSADSWTATSTANAPTGRDLHTALWTGIEMIVWGGETGNSGYLNTGGRYNPRTDTWAATSITNAPSARYAHTAVWTGSEMIVWGGADASNYFNTGGRYNPSTDSWTATSTANAPIARAFHTAVCNGNVIVWGGLDSFGSFNTGGIYNPGTDTWIATSTTNAPDARAYHTAVWTGTEMIAWGGTDASNYFNTGGRYSPSMDTWTATSTTNAPNARAYHTAVWTGSEMIVWAGYDGSNILNTGGRYCAQSQAPMAQSALSRKTHGGAGTFDIPLPLNGNVGVECRSSGGTNDYQMIINFATSVTVENASVTSGTGSVSTFSGSGTLQITVNLTAVANVQIITVTLFNVNDGTHVGDVPVSMGVLVGDVNGNAVVNSSDVSLTKSQVGQPVSSSNFREDVNANGTISGTDVAQVKANVGSALPP